MANVTIAEAMENYLSLGIFWIVKDGQLKGWGKDREKEKALSALGTPERAL